ncbi:MAG TPA: dTDP-4-dehydrorhamnose 3,5-epimerase family protein [Candidatus Ratteibacteria bacterium]|jgi:dTDP-4-dehydrorhamnose 3,5-epimerase|nr:dTDP-4-dehydrorhamnose 3,5-epimerase family protein [bacterium]HON05838.1 dTDP-4-dehydrorhamnose 3,5-epimerase family protein [bacterium]HPC29295.1 dTDP-4-dehydrorhamnose 3,5-epimerase family protein [bacterium]HRS06442.1 dTDP-4-dehydrorhamnose 3,5-epimerase family protein [Candidatus Ratteibacteria bacterium]HRV05095.1 dTDP-4-dehydrorhamnose 3,5-epimerase family protein [Candidatus Ratteibacteria bacterium]
MIKDVKIKKLSFIADERGRLLEILRSDDEIFEKFGQVYITTCYPGVIKAWHLHYLQNDNMIVVSGMAKIVLCDLRESSPTKGEINEFVSGDFNPILVHIPVNVYHGFMCISEKEAIVLNVPTLPYNHNSPDEYRIPFDTEQIPYRWERKNR